MSVPDCVDGLVTTISFAPAVLAGVTAVTVLLSTTAMLEAAVPPMVTVAPLTKLLPLIVMAVPPVVGPQLGVTDNTTGDGPPLLMAM